MITDDLINEWRARVTKGAFDTVREDGIIPPYAFFYTTGDPKYIAVQLDGTNSLIHRSLIATVCEDYDCIAYMVIYASRFIMSKLSISDLQKEISDTGVGGHKDSKTGMVVVFENQCVTRHQVFEYVEGDGGGLVISDDPIMDTIPYDSAYANIINRSDNIKIQMN
jgi:hypothetical protein